MQTITSGDFQRNLGQYQDRALVELVVVTANGRERLVLLSVVEYYRLKRLDRQTLSPADLTDEELAAMMNAPIAPECAQFNHEVTD
jgi:hypothetical protein